LCDFGVSGETIDSIAGTFTGTSYYMAVSSRPFLSYQADSSPNVFKDGLTPSKPMSGPWA